MSVFLNYTKKHVAALPLVPSKRKRYNFLLTNALYPTLSDPSRDILTHELDDNNKRSCEQNN